MLVFGSTILLEKGTFLLDKKNELEKMGHKVRMGNFSSGVHVIIKNNDNFIGGADPRREGIVLGE